MACVPDGLPSLTEWSVVERYRDCALISARPHTGRQHQIRLHLASIGYAVVGDKLYGPDEKIFERSLEGALTHEDLVLLGMARHALHNHRVVFTSPASGERVEVRSELPTDMQLFLEQHR